MKLQVRTIRVELNHGNNIQVPYWELDSGKPGPRVLMTAAFHGNELQGIEVIRRFAPFAAENIVRGSCLFLPLGNLPALRKRQPHIEYVFGRYYGNDNVHNLNCCWPGTSSGSDSQRLVCALKNELADRADYAIDLHCWQDRQATTILTRDGNADSEAFGNVCALPFARRSQKPSDAPNYSLTGMFYNSGRSAVCIEFSGQDVFVEKEIVRGVRAVSNIFRHLGMLSGEIEKGERETLWINDAKEIEVKAPADGIFLKSDAALEAEIKEGDKLGMIFRSDTLETVDVMAPAAGRLFKLGPIADAKPINPSQWQHPYVDKDQVCAMLIVRS